MAEADPDQDQDADKTPSTEDANTSLQTSMKIGKLIFIVTFNEAGLSWVKRGKSTEKAGTSCIENDMSMKCTAETPPLLS